MGGIYTGVFTPSEAGAAGAVAALIIALLLRRLSLNSFWESLVGSARSTGMIFIIIVGMTVFARFLAITGLPFGKLTASREIREIMLRIGSELFAVGQAEGIIFESFGAGMNVGRFLSNEGYSRLVKHLLLRIIGYINRHDESSMLDSMQRGFKTEIDFINGRVVQGAEQSGIQAPYNRLAVQMIEQMERGNRRPALENLAAFRNAG